MYMLTALRAIYSCSSATPLLSSIGLRLLLFMLYTLQYTNTNTLYLHRYRLYANCRLRLHSAALAARCSQISSHSTPRRRESRAAGALRRPHDSTRHTTAVGRCRCVCYMSVMIIYAKYY